MDKEVGDWLDQAGADLKTSQDNITSKNYYASVLFSQQAAEKALKADYILLFKKLPPKIHDLAELGRLVSASEEILVLCQSLAMTYFSSRYPGVGPVIPAKFYTVDMARNHFKEAEVILQWAKKKIKL